MLATGKKYCKLIVWFLSPREWYRLIISWENHTRNFVHWTGLWKTGWQRKTWEGRPRSPDPGEVFLVSTLASPRKRETLERAKYIWPQGWWSQVGCWDKGHKASESNSYIHKLRLSSVKGPGAKDLGEKGERERSGEERMNERRKKIPTALSDFACLDTCVELHNLESYVLLQNMITFLLGALPHDTIVFSWLNMGSIRPRTNVPRWTSNKQFCREKARAPQESPGPLSLSTEAILLVGLGAPVEALCGCANAVVEHRVHKRNGTLSATWAA